MRVTNLENDVASLVRQPSERDVTRQEKAGAPRKPHRGDAWTLVVTPPPSYAGTAGTRATIQSASSLAISVLFESGLRESFPPGRFAAYFKLALASYGD